MKTRIALAALVAATLFVCSAQATLTSTSNTVSYLGNGATTSFTVPFKFLANTDLIVTVAGATQTLNTAYTVSGAGNATGTVTFTTAPATSAAVVITRTVDYTQRTSLAQNRTPDPRTVESALDKLAMGEQQLAAKEAADLGVVNNAVAAFNASGAAAGSTTSVLATGSTIPRTLAARAADVANPKDFGAKGDATTDDTAAIQAALNTGLDVVCPVSATYKIANSLYMQTVGQTLSGACTITMDAGLAKPMLCLGASSTSCAASSTQISNMKVRGVQFVCTGTRTNGSAGISYVFATTSTLDSVRVWGCYAGVDVRGNSIVNTVLNADLRQNNYGFWDKTDATGLINFQGSALIAGRYEQNVQEGIVLGSNDVRIIGSVIEGNSNIPLGGTGTNPEIRITQGIGSGTGSTDLTDVYMETLAGNTSTSMIQVDATANKRLTLKGGNFYGNDATNKCVVQTNSTGTAQYYGIFGGNFASFKNYICGAITNGSAAVVLPTGYDANRDVSATLSATAGATILQYDRLLGLKMTGTIGTNVPSVTAGTVTTTAASGAIAINMVLGSFLSLGGTSNIQGNGTGQVILSGNTFLTGGGTATLHAGTVTADGADLNLRSVNNRVSLPTITFANLGAPASGAIAYCSDCTVANPCAGSGTGALAKRVNGAWVCN